MPQQKVLKVQWCKFYWSKKGCDKEDRCGYMHFQSDYGKAAPDKEDQVPVCGEWRSHGTCSRGGTCSL